MKPVTRMLSAVGVAMITAGLVLGGNSAAGSPTPSTPTTVPMPMSQMPGMGSMMTGDPNAMATMMGSTDMAAMHAMMHQMMKGAVDDDVLAACDRAHATMVGAMSSRPAQGQAQHEAHHGWTRS